MTRRLHTLAARTFACVAILVAILALAAASLAQEGDAAADRDDALAEGALLRIGSTGSAAGFYGGIYHVVFSPDGKRLATRSFDQVVRLWDSSTGQKVWSVERPDASVRDVIFSTDGSAVVTSERAWDEEHKREKDQIRFWDAATGKSLRSIEAGGSILRLCDSGKTLKVVGEQECQSYQFADGKLVVSQRWHLHGSETALDLSHDGNLLSCYSHTHGSQGRHFVALRELATGSQTSLTRMNAAPRVGRFSPDARWFVVGCRKENQAILWRIDQPQQPKSLTGHTGDVQSLAFSHDGRMLATGSFDHTVRLWEVFSARPIVTLPGHSETVCAVAFSADDRRLATGASGRSDNSTVIWDLRRILFGQPPPEKLQDTALAQLWEQLGLEEPAAAYKAMGKLVASPDEATAFFATQVDAIATGAGRQRVEQLIRDLDNDQFDVREAAHRELLKVRALADALLRKALDETTSAEVRYRVSRILEVPVTQTPIKEGDVRRMHRLVFALEVIGTEAASTQLDRLATGHPHIDIMHEATAAARRLAAARDENRSAHLETRHPSTATTVANHNGSDKP